MAIFDINRSKELLNENQIILEDTISDTNNYPNIGKGLCKIQVFGGEGEYIPHFHVNSDNIDTCIQIKENRYFDHGGHNKLITSVSDRKTLNKWLDKPSRFKNGKTNFQSIVELWNRKNPSAMINNNILKPDYTNILPYKEK